MDGTRRIKLGGRQSHPVIFPENIMIGPQRIIKTAGWEVVTLTGTVLLSSIENNYFPDGIIQRSLFNSGIISIFERYFNPLHPVIVFLLATRWCWVSRARWMLWMQSACGDCEPMLRPWALHQCELWPHLTSFITCFVDLLFAWCV